MDGSSLRVLSWKKCEGRRHEAELNSAPMSCSNMDVDFERSDFFEDLLSDDGSFGAKMGLSYSPDSGHGSPQSFTSSGSSSAVGHLRFYLPSLFLCSFLDLLSPHPYKIYANINYSFLSLHLL